MCNVHPGINIWLSSKFQTITTSTFHGAKPMNPLVPLQYFRSYQCLIANILQGTKILGNDTRFNCIYKIVSNNPTSPARNAKQDSSTHPDKTTDNHSTEPSTSKTPNPAVSRTNAPEPQTTSHRSPFETSDPSPSLTQHHREPPSSILPRSSACYYRDYRCKTR